MIRITLVIMLECISIQNSCAQLLGFYRNYSDVHDVHLFSAHEGLDNGFLTAGSSVSSIGGNYLIIKTDSNGIEQWRRIGNLFNQLDSDNVANGIIQCEDKSIVSCGTISQFLGGAGSDYQNFLVKLDSSGNRIWEKSFGNDTVFETLWDICSLANNQFLCAGVSFTTQSNLTITKFDSSGVAIWNDVFSVAPYFANKSYISHCLNSDLLIITALSSNGSVITRIDSSGN